MDETTIARLVEAATATRQNAYSPYSHHLVGSAVLDADGHIFSGCNVETVTLQQSMHAERTAVAAMVAGGGRRILAVTVVGPYSGVPCAECRQVIWEFCGGDPEVVVISAPLDEPIELLTIGSIYPRPYGPETKGINPRDY
ncbi:cytidine deaminase [Agromyces subbeticus]|uniref:cytidine deaminase n=1 Tax=Agromyces subbeticus TaxID=293890 RepID=UPI0003B62171|nr:cytidine deaminase [Agromyces subbeticus]